MLLTVREAAALLRATERQVSQWVQIEGMPVQRVRDQLRFNATDLVEWATSRSLPVSLEAFNAGLDADGRVPGLADALRIGGAHAGLAAVDRETALRAAVQHTPLPPAVDREFIVEVLVAREASAASAIRHGIAIPHVRQPIVAAGARAAVSVSYLAQPVPFGAPDGQPVATLVLIISPTVRTHLQMSVRLARALQDTGFHAALERQAPTAELVAHAARIEGPSNSCPPPPTRNGEP